MRRKEDCEFRRSEFCDELVAENVIKAFACLEAYSARVSILSIRKKCGKARRVKLRWNVKVSELAAVNQDSRERPARVTRRTNLMFNDQRDVAMSSPRVKLTAFLSKSECRDNDGQTIWLNLFHRKTTSRKIERCGCEVNTSH